MSFNLHQGQSHEILRSWQSQRNDVNHHKDFVLPMFIGNNNDSIEPIESMPEVYRYGCNRAVEYLEPLVCNYGLRAVLLFPVVTKSDQAQLDALQADDDDVDSDGVLSSTSTSSSTPRSTTTSHSTSDIDDDDDDDDGNGARSEKRLSKGALPGAGHHLLPGGDDSDGHPATVGAGLSQNPFLNQSEEEEEDHLLGAEQVMASSDMPEPAPPMQHMHARHQMHPKRPANNSNGHHKSLDAKLIRGMALKDEHNPVLRLIPRLRARFPELLIICDVCLCAFTSTGHCCLFDTDMSTVSRAKHLDHHFMTTPHLADVGTAKQPQPPPLNKFPISNKITCQYVAKLAVEYALRGCNVVAPSDMMDGRVLQIRQSLDENRLSHVAILSYSAKFASAFYGPFRQATNNAPEFGDRRAYQLPPGSRAMALKAAQRDIREGADFLMVKPGGPYLDIVRDIRDAHPSVPIAIYQVSGEYAMLKLAAKANILDLKLAVDEMLTSFRRAGASIIITYFTPELLRGDL